MFARLPVRPRVRCPELRSIAGGLAISAETWEARQTDLLTAADFSGGTPDFSATGGPITFGFIRSNTRGTASPQIVAHGVDNFQVEIRR